MHDAHSQLEVRLSSRVRFQRERNTFLNDKFTKLNQLEIRIDDIEEL